MRSPSPTASASQPGCVSWGVPVTLMLKGGVTTSAVTDPAIGVLVRLGLACYLGIPLSDVTITGIANGSAAVVVASDATVNKQSGSCSSLSARVRALRPSDGSSGGNAAAWPRELETAGASVTNVTLVAVVGACALSADGTPGLSAQLSALVAGLPGAPVFANASATGAALQLGSFLSAAATASGLPREAVSVTASVGSPWAAGSASGGAGSSPTGGGSPVPVATIVATVVVLVVVALAALAVFVLLRRRHTGPADNVVACNASPGLAGDAGFVSGINPMRAARRPDDSEQMPGRQRQNADPDAAAATDTSRPRRGSVRSVLGGPRSASSSVGAPPGLLDNPMHSASSSAASKCRPPQVQAV